MTIVFTPDPVENPGELVKANVKYTGPRPPVPNDVHLDVQQPDGTWRAITGYERIPEDRDPLEGFDLPFSSGNPHVGGPGLKKFRVRWTLDGNPIPGVAPEEKDLRIWPPTGPRRTCLGLLPAGWDCAKVLKAIGDALRRPK